jgi:hypothetical protein
LPFPLPEYFEDNAKANLIIEEVNRIVTSLLRSLENSGIRTASLVEDAKRQIDPLIFEYFEASDLERILIEDTIKVYEPSSTPSNIYIDIPTTQDVSGPTRKSYCEMLCTTLNDFSSKGKQKVSCSATISKSLRTAIIEIKKSPKTIPYVERSSSKELEIAIARINKALKMISGRIFWLLGAKVFIDDSIYLIKPLDAGSWTKTAALNDADEIAIAILSQ